VAESEGVDESRFEWVGQFQWSLHGWSSIALSRALVTEAASALAVDDRGGVICTRLGDAT